MQCDNCFKINQSLIEQWRIHSGFEDEYLQVATNATVLWKNLNQAHDVISIRVRFIELQEMKCYRISV